MIVGVPKETAPGERRVALVPDLIPKLAKAGLEVVVQSGAGAAAGFPDPSYVAKGAPRTGRPRGGRHPPQSPAADRRGDRPPQGRRDPDRLPPALHERRGDSGPGRRKVTAFAMELMPRITRAQSMDALSAMSTVAGYKAVLIAANRLAQVLPAAHDRRRHGRAGARLHHRRGRGRVCKRSARPSGSAPSSRPTTRARPSRSRSKAWGRSSSSSAWRPKTPRPGPATPRRSRRSSTSGSGS